MVSHLGTALTLFAIACQGAVAQTRYDGPGACASCHQQIADTYAPTGMARSFGNIGENDPVSKTTGPVFRHEASAELFSLAVREAKTYVRRSQLGESGAATNELEVAVSYRIGSGNHARSYLAWNRSSDLVELPITWYSEMGGHWAMSPGYDRPDHAGFSRKVTFRCMFCHNAYPGMVAAAGGPDRPGKFPSRLPEGIDCQRCHGPGSDHIQAARSGSSLDTVKRAIVNPARLDPERQMEICLRCHLETTNLPLPASLVRYDRAVFSYRPGEPLENYILHFDRAPGSGYDQFEFTSAPYRLRKSACFRSSAGALTCTSCHNPHDVPRGGPAVAYYSRVCRSCHETTIARKVSRGLHPTADECLSCHMATRRPSDAIHVNVTDHYIRKLPEANPFDELVERNDGNTQPYRGPVVLYYPEVSPQTPESELYLAAAQVKNQANLEQGIPRLETAIARWKPDRMEFYLDLANAYRSAGALEKAIPVYEEACARARGYWRPFYNFGIALLAAGQNARAAGELLRAARLAPLEATPLYGLARALVGQGRVQEALTVLQKATELDPDSAEIRSDLGIAWLRLGNSSAAESALREALRLRPEIASIHINLAELLSRRRNFSEAKFHLETAIRLSPGLAEAHSAYATALVPEGRLAEARAQYEAALRIDPRLAVTHNNLGALLFQMGDAEGAVREYRPAISARPDYAAAHYNLGVALASRGGLEEAENSLESAIRYLPDYYEAHLKLGQLLASQGAELRARPHFLKAAESPDPELRREALKALK